MKLLVMTPCERVLQDPEAGHSLIGVFHEIKIQIPGTAPLPPNDGVVPRLWCVFTKFELAPDEENRPYSLLTEVFWPDGKLFVSGELIAAQPTKNGLAFITRFEGLPIGQNGAYRVQQTLKSNGQEASPPFTITFHIQVEAVLPPPGTVTQ